MALLLICVSRFPSTDHLGLDHRSCGIIPVSGSLRLSISRWNLDRILAIGNGFRQVASFAEGEKVARRSHDTDDWLLMSV